MKTGDLIGALAADVPAVDPARVARGFCLKPAAAGALPGRRLLHW